MSEPTPDLPRHYHLVAAQLIFQTQPDAQPEQTMLNTTIRTDKPFVTAADLAKAQQAVQMLLHQQMGKPVIIHNVIILSVSDLGLMTEEQFINDLNRMREQAAGSGQPN